MFEGGFRVTEGGLREGLRVVLVTGELWLLVALWLRVVFEGLRVI